MHARTFEVALREPLDTGIQRTTGARRARLRAARQRRDALYRRPLAVSDALAFLGSLWIGVSVIGGMSPTAWVVLGVPVTLIVAKLSGLYDHDENRLHGSTLDEVPALFGLATLAALLASLCGDLLVAGGLSELDVLAIWLTMAAFLVLGRIVTRAATDALARPERCVLIGDPRATGEVARRIGFQALNVEIVATLPTRHAPATSDQADHIGDNGRGPDGDGMIADDERGEEDGAALIRRVSRMIDREHADRVILASGTWPAERLLHAVGELMSSGVKVSVVPSTSGLASLSYEVDQLPGMAILGMKRFGISRSSLLVKRTLDLVVSSAALLLLSPLMAAIAVAIRLDSPGPALYRQYRIGKNGKRFEMLKFRSMVAGAHQQREALRGRNEANGLFKIRRDPRITRVGRLIRRRSLDELPQLVNVFRGQMSLVGPRPLLPTEDAQVEGAFRRRLNVSPGITGQWQTLGAWRIPIDDMVVIDYLYAANWSLWSDIKLLARTVPFVAGGRGA